MDEQTLRDLAAQLRQPEGEKGIQVARQMEQTNSFMITASVDTLTLKRNDHVLEIGFGNGNHVNYLLQQVDGISYTGIDISALMLQEAIANNKRSVTDGQAVFKLTEGKHIPSDDAAFDAVFTVNTIYFWEDVTVYLSEIMRVLKPGGRGCITFGLKSFMEQLPFVGYGFTLYSHEEVEQLLKKSGAVHIASELKTETVMSNAGYAVERTFAITAFSRP